MIYSVFFPLPLLDPNQCQGIDFRGATLQTINFHDHVPYKPQIVHLCAVLM
jgi:hypothetical protein